MEGSTGGERGDRVGTFIFFHTKRLTSVQQSLYLMTGDAEPDSSSKRCHTRHPASSCLLEVLVTSHAINTILIHIAIKRYVSEARGVILQRKELK